MSLLSGFANTREILSVLSGVVTFKTLYGNTRGSDETGRVSRWELIFTENSYRRKLSCTSGQTDRGANLPRA